MFITADNKILIRELRLFKKWRVKKSIREFLDKNQKCSTLKDLLRKIDKTGYVRHYILDKISTVEDLILSQDNYHSHASPREIVQTTGISRSSVRRIAKNEINLKVFNGKRVPKQKRLMCFRNLLRMYTSIKAART